MVSKAGLRRFFWGDRLGRGPRLKLAYTRACRPLAAHREFPGYSRRLSREVSFQPNCFGKTLDSHLKCNG